jgi:hypothetical protein
MFLNCWTCFERHTAHHQELKNYKPETCWAAKKHWNNKFYYTVASCWLFLYNLYYDARNHEHQVHKNVYCLQKKKWYTNLWVPRGLKYRHLFRPFTRKPHVIQDAAFLSQNLLHNKLISGHRKVAAFVSLRFPTQTSTGTSCLIAYINVLQVLPSSTNIQLPGHCLYSHFQTQNMLMEP